MGPSDSGVSQAIRDVGPVGVVRSFSFLGSCLVSWVLKDDDGSFARLSGAISHSSKQETPPVPAPRRTRSAPRARRARGTQRSGSRCRPPRAPQRSPSERASARCSRRRVHPAATVSAELKSGESKVGNEEMNPKRLAFLARRSRFPGQLIWRPPAGSSRVRKANLFGFISSFPTFNFRAFNSALTVPWS